MTFMICGAHVNFFSIVSLSPPLPDFRYDAGSEAVAAQIKDNPDAFIIYYHMWLSEPRISSNLMYVAQSLTTLTGCE